MKVLVIGGAGYIGSHVVLELLKQRLEVCVYDDLSTGYETNIPAGVQFVQGDVLDPVTLTQAMVGCEAVIHLAAKKAVGESMLNPQKYATYNIGGMLNVLNTMGNLHIPYLIFSSSAAVYGMPDKQVLDESTPTNPINFYGFTKLEAERFLPWADRLANIKSVALRYFNAVGYDAEGRVKGMEKDPQNLLPIVMEVANGTRASLSIFGNDYPTADGTCIRDYIHVSDLASAHVLALSYLDRVKKSEILNLGTGKGHSVLEIVTKSAEITGQKINYQFAPRRLGDPAVLMANADKAHALLKWKPEHSTLDNIIKTTWFLYKK
ncbi:MAG: UDP-glucose 4-epimerase GalE [Lactobacillales bacterium]|jgi:UDP-glucose 4-epimerase|nr:UDP-glucose 4-epimerase GalE [Lactobacillales bacterium]